MILTQEEINKLGCECGYGHPCGDYFSEPPNHSNMIWCDGDPTELIRAAEKLILEKIKVSTVFVLYGSFSMKSSCIRFGTFPSMDSAVTEADRLKLYEFYVEEIIVR